MKNKILTRNILENLPISLNYLIYKPTDSLKSILKKAKKIKFPLIIKSPSSTGSKDVLLAKDKDELIASIQFLLGKCPNTEILLEEYIEGPQYLVEILVKNGEVHIIAVIEQEVTLFERFIVNGYSLLGQVDEELYNRLFDISNSVIKAFYMENGACHLELRRKNDIWKLIEINPTISGGAMNHMIKIGYGINLV